MSIVFQDCLEFSVSMTAEDLGTCCKNSLLITGYKQGGLLAIDRWQFFLNFSLSIKREITGYHLSGFM